jgi:Tfp pilus assembly protein PilX
LLVLGLFVFFFFRAFARSRRISALRCSGDLSAQRAAADFRCIARM